MTCNHKIHPSMASQEALSSECCSGEKLCDRCAWDFYYENVIMPAREAGDLSDFENSHDTFSTEAVSTAKVPEEGHVTSEEPQTALALSDTATVLETFDGLQDLCKECKDTLECNGFFRWLARIGSL